MGYITLIEKAKTPLEIGRDGLVWLGKETLTKTLDYVDDRIADYIKGEGDEGGKGQKQWEYHVPDVPAEVLSGAEEISQMPNIEQRKEQAARIAELLKGRDQVTSRLANDLLEGEDAKPSQNELLRGLYSVIRFYAETPRHDAIDLVRSDEVANIINAG